MKKSNPCITLLGSNSGNNLGDAAIMSAAMDAITNEMPDAEFMVPTVNPEFTNKHYGSKYKVKAYDIMPWTLSLRFLGVPTFWCLLKSDAALICDGIIFGKKFFNPAFNMLVTLIFLVPWAKLVNCKLVCYSCGIGPFPNKISKIAARYLLNSCDLVIMRENDSKKLAEEIGVTQPIEVTGDAAFINEVSSEERAKELAQILKLDWNKKWLGINVTAYADTWLKPEEQVGGSSKIVNTIVEAIKIAKNKINDDFSPILFCTHPMDRTTCQELADKISAPVVDNSTYLSHDIQALMRKCDLFMGMRFHSVVLASAVESPIIGLIYAPKVRGFMRLLDCEEYGLELASLTPEILAEKICSAWNIRKEIQAKQKSVIDKLKVGARNAATTLKNKIFPNYSQIADVSENRKLTAY